MATIKINNGLWKCEIIQEYYCEIGHSKYADEFSLGNRESREGYNDPVYGWRPNAYGGRFYRLSGGVAQGRGFGIHGSDQYNDPNKY